MEWTDMIFPCCKISIPAPLDGVAEIQCRCGAQFPPKVIKDYNELVDQIKGWRDIVNGKALIKPEPGETSFVTDLMRRGRKILDKINSAQLIQWNV